MAENATAETSKPIAPSQSRASGILLHPTSLPAAGGVGDLGQGAFNFVDFLVAARQALWQIMPLGPVGLGNSPYAAASAFAGAPLLVCLQELIDRGWLEETALGQAPEGAAERVQFEAAAAFKQRALSRAFERFEATAGDADRAGFEAFLERQGRWLNDFALFMALKEAHGGGAWFDWDQPLVRRDPAALDSARRKLGSAIRAHQFAQYIFFEQWGTLKSYANRRGVRLIGDIPIFVASDSADVWVNQEIFFLEQSGQSTVVAGVPPDAFSATGQRWGNPLYRWDRLAERGYDWWIDRFRGALQQVDVIRLDHFRGFEAYWEVPADRETAEHGRWVEGPGGALFAAVERELGRVPMIVEDLGLITPAVELLREQLGYPGMKVLHFAFGDDADGPVRGRNPYLPHNHIRDCVVYTGTHDNDTTVGWFASLAEAERHSVRRYLATDGSDIAWDLIRAALCSVADTTIVPLQDVLELGSEGRMNVPGNPHDNWTWRYREGQLRPEHAHRLAELTAIYGRTPALGPGAAVACQS